MKKIHWASQRLLGLARGLGLMEAQLWRSWCAQFGAFFHFYILKKLKFQKYMAVSKNFKTIPPSPLAWATGGLSPCGWATRPKCKKKYI